MGKYGQFTINDDIATIIRKEARRLNVPEWFAMAIAGAESDWNPSACGDTHPNKDVVVGAQTYKAMFCAYKNTWACSWGLFQLNICGGQGYSADWGRLISAQYNTEIAMPHLQYGASVATENGAEGKAWVWQASINSGHPGFVPIDDYRINAIWGIALKLIFNADGSWAVWPTLEGEIPTPEYPTQEWTELHTLTLRLLQIQEQTQRSLELTRTLLETAYGKASAAPLTDLQNRLRNLS